MNRRTLANLKSTLNLALLFTASLAAVNLSAAKNEPNWADEKGWSDLTNFSTIQAVSVGDDVYLLARGNSGMTTLRYHDASDKWDTVATNDPQWSDAQGWSDLSNYSTIQAVNVSDELYLLARSNFGMITRRYDKAADRWENLAHKNPPWSDTDNWKDISNYSTIQAVGVANELYLLGRSKSGIDTLRYNRASDSWDAIASNDPLWSDDNGWNDLSNSDTIQTVSTGGELYLLARANSGMITLRYDRDTDLWQKAALNDPKWSDKNGWADRANYSTIQAIGSNGKLCLLARANSGMMTLQYDHDSNNWRTISSNYPEWSDSTGWGDFTNYSTIQALIAGEDMFMLARTNYGMTSLRYDYDTGQWKSIASNDPMWSDDNGWNEFSKYSTIQAVVAKDNLLLFARDKDGMITRSYNSSADLWADMDRAKTK